MSQKYKRFIHAYYAYYLIRTYLIKQNLYMFNKSHDREDIKKSLKSLEDKNRFIKAIQAHGDL